MSCLDKIGKLYMTDCNITEEGVRVITEHIKNCSNLVRLVIFLVKITVERRLYPYHQQFTYNLICTDLCKTLP